MRVTRKFNMVRKAGGKCFICGYKKNLSSLAFHHIAEKSVGLSGQFLARMSVHGAEQELDKCVLVCHNCHCEIHNPELALEPISKMCKLMKDKKITQEQAYKQFFEPGSN
jgi:hypothetical protein